MNEEKKQAIRAAAREAARDILNQGSTDSCTRYIEPDGYFNWPRFNTAQSFAVRDFLLHQHPAEAALFSATCADEARVILAEQPVSG